MNIAKTLTILTVTAVALVVSRPVIGADKEKAKDAKDAKAKPYPLKTCIVQDEKLDKDAYVFVYQGQEIKLCCESCKDDFNKEPAKYLKKITDAEKKK
jgi:YHS domain-containing protein